MKYLISCVLLLLFVVGNTSPPVLDQGSGYSTEINTTDDQSLLIDLTIATDAATYQTYGEMEVSSFMDYSKQVDFSINIINTDFESMDVTYLDVKSMANLPETFVVDYTLQTISFYTDIGTYEPSVKTEQGYAIAYVLRK